MLIQNARVFVLPWAMTSRQYETAEKTELPNIDMSITELQMYVKGWIVVKRSHVAVTSQ